MVLLQVLSSPPQPLLLLAVSVLAGGWQRASVADVRAGIVAETGLQLVEHCRCLGQHEVHEAPVRWSLVM